MLIAGAGHLTELMLEMYKDGSSISNFGNLPVSEPVSTTVTVIITVIIIIITTLLQAFSCLAS
jgi:carbon starvation protein CstA